MRLVAINGSSRPNSRCKWRAYRRTPWTAPPVEQGALLKVRQTYEYLSSSESMLILEGDYLELTPEGQLAATHHLPAASGLTDSWLISVRSFLHDEP